MSDFNYKSDRRIKGGKSGICPLCLHEKQLILSHVTPKWCYHWAKLEGNGSFVGSYPSIGRNVRIQDGSKHYMLCTECDQYLGDAENYVKFLMHGNSDEQQKINLTRKVTESGNEIYIGVNVEFIQRFVLGLVLKSQYANSAPFHNISISEDSIEKVRFRILNPKSDDLDYPIIAMCFNSNIIKDIDPKAIMIPQYLKSETGEQAVSFLIAGWEWVVTLNEDRKLSEKVILDNRLQKNGLLHVLKDDILEQRHVDNMRKMSRRDRRKIERGKSR